MKFRPAVLALLLGAAALPAFAQAARYEIDPNHLSIGFLVDHIGYNKVLGMFLKGRGTYAYDEAAGQLSDVKVEIDADSVFTNQRQRDSHIRGDDFLDAGDFPKIVFTATGGKRTGERSWEVPGQIEIRGKAQPVTLQATVNKVGESPLPGKPYVMGVSARTTLKRSAFGMSYALSNGWVGDEVAVILEFEAIRR